MAITILPQSDTAWGNIASQAGKGIGQGLEALANMKMQEYQNKQLYKQQQEQQEAQYKQIENDLDQAGLGQFKSFIRIPGGIDLARTLAQGGFNFPGQQQQSGTMQQQPSSIAQTMNTLNPQGQDQQMSDTGMNMQQQGMMQQPNMMQPSMTSDPTQALRNSAYNTPQMQQARALENQREKSREKRDLQKQKFAKENTKIGFENKEKEALGTEKRQEDKEIRQDNIKYINQQLPIHESNQYVGQKVKKARAILDKYGKEFPTGLAKYSNEQLQKILIQNPHVRDFMNLMSDIVLKRSTEVKGQPRAWEKDLISDTKAAINQPLETMYSRLNELDEDTRLDAERLAYETAVSRANKKGRPVGLSKAMSDFELAHINPLATPEPYGVGTILDGKYLPNGKDVKIIEINGEKQFKELP